MSSENDAGQDWLDDENGGENTGEGSREHGAGWPDPASDSVSISKEEGDDGSETTRVIHPPRKLKAPGELRLALMSGCIDLEEFKTGCQDGMNAMKAIPCKNGTIAYEPDWQIRLAFRKFVVETVEGMPVKRQEIISKKLTTTEDMEKMLAKSPAARRSMRALLEKMEKLAEEKALSKKGAKK